jgi:hypothetical protein
MELEDKTEDKEAQQTVREIINTEGLEGLVFRRHKLLNNNG